MVHDAPIRRLELDGRDVGIPREIGGNYEAAIGVRARSGYVEALCRLEHQVGRPQRPAHGERGVVAADARDRLGVPPLQPRPRGWQFRCARAIGHA